MLPLQGAEKPRLLRTFEQSPGFKKGGHLHKLKAAGIQLSMMANPRANIIQRRQKDLSILLLIFFTERNSAFFFFLSEDI